MQRLAYLGFLSALLSLSLAGACSKSDSGGSPTAQEPTTGAVPSGGAPGAGEPGAGAPGATDDQVAQGDLRNMPADERRAARRQEKMREFDTDKDGRLSRAEREVMRAAGIDKRMKRIDRDGDGKISRQEAQSGRMGPRLLADFDRADANRDSTISREELAAALDEFRARRRAERQQAGGAAAAPGNGPGAPPPAEDDPDSLDEE